MIGHLSSTKIVPGMSCSPLAARDASCSGGLPRLSCSGGSIYISSLLLFLPRLRKAVEISRK
eukprot:767321-Hanusia_phi.AAC.8